MYALYVDESGHCGKKYDKTQPVEVLVGVIVDLTKLPKAQREYAAFLDAIKKLGVHAEEIKMREVYGGRADWEKVPPIKRDEAIGHAIGLVGERKCKILASPIDTKKFFQLVDDQNAAAKWLEYPYETGVMNLLIAVQKEQKKKGKNKGRTFIILDEQKGHDDHLLKMLNEDLSITDTATGFTGKRHEQRMDQIIDVPFFSKSHLAVLIQLADCVAFVLNRYLKLSVYGIKEAYADEKDKLAGWVDQIVPYLFSHTSTDPRGQAEICEFYRKSVRPDRWDPKIWKVK
jgi:hypothetical protein